MLTPPLWRHDGGIGAAGRRTTMVRTKPAKTKGKTSRKLKDLAARGGQVKGGGGKVKVSDIVIVKNVDKSSPTLL
jgi:hypothetical protein